MAPEIIEMTGQQSSACDIWSVGCTVLELLTGKPPYFDMQQMPALFRIVQDEHPPLPDNISPALEDFLLQCFQKDPNRRIDAPSLLKHNWLKKTVEKLAHVLNVPSTVSATLKPVATISKPVTAAATLRPQVESLELESDEDWDAEIENENQSNKNATASTAAGGISKAHLITPDVIQQLLKREEQEKQKQAAAESTAATLTSPTTPNATISAAITPLKLTTAGSNQLRLPSPSPTTSDSKPRWAVSTMNAPAASNKAVVTRKPAAVLEMDDVLDELTDDEDIVVKPSTAKSTATRQSLSHAVPAANNKQRSSLAASNAVNNQPAAKRDLNDFVETDDESYDLDESVDESNIDLNLHRNNNAHRASVMTSHAAPASTAQKRRGSRANALNHDNSSGHNTDAEDLDWDSTTNDLDTSLNNSTNSNEHRHSHSHSALELNETAITKQFHRAIGHLTPHNDTTLLLDTCNTLLSLASDTSTATHFAFLMVQHGVVPVLEMLECPEDNILYLVLKLINFVSTSNLKYQYNLCLSGIIPLIIRLGREQHSTSVVSSNGRQPSTDSKAIDIRVETANFIRLLCYNSDFTRKLFIACDGLPILVDFLDQYNLAHKFSATITARTDNDHSQQHHTTALLYNTIDCIRHIFDIQSSPKNDFCRLFCKYQLLQPLSVALVTLVQQQRLKDSDNDECIAYIRKACQILLLFSEGDKHVKVHLADGEVVYNLLLCIASAANQRRVQGYDKQPTYCHLPNDCITYLLKCIKNISMESTTLDSLEACSTIPILVPMLSTVFADGVTSTPLDHQSNALLALYYLCQIKASRQESAAMSGIFPHLIRIITENSPLKQFAYPLIFSVAKSSHRARCELKKYSGIHFLVSCLQDPYWRTNALDVLAVWVNEDSKRLEFLFNTSAHIHGIIQCFITTSNPAQAEKVFECVRILMSTYQSLCISLGYSTAFIHNIKIRLETVNNVTRRLLLRIAALLIIPKDNAAMEIMEREEMIPIFKRIAADSSVVILNPIATKILQRFESRTGMSVGSYRSGQQFNRTPSNPTTQQLPMSAKKPLVTAAQRQQHQHQQAPPSLVSTNGGPR